MLYGLVLIIILQQMVPQKLVPAGDSKMLNAKTNKSRVLAHLNQKFKQHQFYHTTNRNTTEVAMSSVNKGYMGGDKIERVIFYLSSTGCTWCKTEFGGCLMCGHYHGTTKGRHISKQSYYQQFIAEYQKYNFSRYPMVCIYNAGSMLNPDEMHYDDLGLILSTIDENPLIKHLIIESRPEYITDEAIRIIKRNIRKTIIEIGIGLETTSETVRDLCINKGFSFDDYKTAAKMIKNNGIKLLTYLTVKPLFLTENEAVKDVLESIASIENFTDVISLEPTSIQRGTLVEYFYNNGYYSIPRGWLIQDIVRSLYSNRRYLPFELRIGGFEFYPTPDYFVSNCPECDQELYESIDTYNTFKEHNPLISLDCECRSIYSKSMSLEDRFLQIGDIGPRISGIIADNLFKGYNAFHARN